MMNAETAMDRVIFTTLDGLKRAAKKLKKRENISHTAALESIAISGGFESYKAAKMALEIKP